MPVPEPQANDSPPEISDEEYARLSAEKQVFEKSKNRGQKKEEEDGGSKSEEEKTSSSASSVNLGVVAGEVFPPGCRAFSHIYFYPVGEIMFPSSDVLSSCSILFDMFLDLHL